jgi:predicted transcriptional regulator
VIVRIATESQYHFPDDQADRLNDLDNAVVAAVEAGDEDRFHEAFEELLALVRSEGTPVEAEDLEGSDVILPPPDISITEASADFTGEGLIPD